MDDREKIMQETFDAIRRLIADRRQAGWSLQDALRMDLQDVRQEIPKEGNK